MLRACCACVSPHIDVHSAIYLLQAGGPEKTAGFKGGESSVAEDESANNYRGES
jgi:hypothetical protein